MKKTIVLLLAVCLLFSATGCSLLTEEEGFTKVTKSVFSLDGYPLAITADSTFRQDTGGSFDLQITNDKAYISIMVYAYIDLPSDITPADVYTIQNEELFSKREAVALIEEAETQPAPVHMLAQALYSAEKDGTKNYYATYLLDFPDAQACAWVLVSAMPSYLTNNREYLHEMVCSLTVAE